MKNTIVQKLQEIEGAENIKILYACEAGSRAWGFESTDSDYDVRFIYLRKLKDIVALDSAPDTLEYGISDNLDISGWDLKKTLNLMAKSNPPLVEWLFSPTVYMENKYFHSHMADLSKTYYSRVNSIHHYLHMARGNYREYLQGDRIWIKKYLYVIRPLLAVKFIHDGRGIPPVNFNDLLYATVSSKELLDAINNLLEKKKAGKETGFGNRIPEISDFIDSELLAWEKWHDEREPYEQKQTLNDFYYDMLLQYS